VIFSSWFWFNPIGHLVYNYSPFYAVIVPSVRFLHGSHTRARLDVLADTKTLAPIRFYVGRTIGFLCRTEFYTATIEYEVHV